MIGGNNSALPVMADWMQWDSFLVELDFSALPEFVAVGLTVLGGLGAGVLPMLAGLVLVDILGGHMAWWENRYALKDWMRPDGPGSLAGRSRPRAAEGARALATPA